MLSDRRQRVLAALIEEYVARAMPVGSRTLTERYQLGVSPATVRNELSVLEDGGYIAQPHTSAGRVPTDVGYRAFVDNLMQTGFLDEAAPDPKAVDDLRKSATELDSLLEKTSSALARMTDCLSVVLAPSVFNLHLKQVSLISIAPTRVLIVAVMEDGQVFNRQIDFVEDIPVDDLARIQRDLNASFAGKSLQDVEEGLSKGVIEAMRNPLLRCILSELIDCVRENELSRAHSLGVSSLLAQPEFRHAQAILPVMQILEDDAVLLELLDDSFVSRDGVPCVKIGTENVSEKLAGVSVIASKYGRGDSAGVVAVIGPTRMDYSKVMRAVKLASSMLDDVG